jgi:hypothetical protein
MTGFFLAVCAHSHHHAMLNVSTGSVFVGCAERAFGLRVSPRPDTHVRPKEDICVRMLSISPDGELAITASETSSKNDFDYLVGHWNIRNRTLNEPLAGSDKWDEFDSA